MERRKRAERALTSVMATCYQLGVSTRRMERLGLRLGDLRPGEKRLFITDGKGGHQRIVPVSARFFTSLADYLELERPSASTDRVFVALRVPVAANRSARPGLMRSSPVHAAAPGSLI